MKKLNHARRLLAQIDKELDGIQFISNDDRNRVSGALFDIVLDHAKAVIVLFESKIYPSAFALARPLFEGFVRASWLLNCATEDDIDRFIKKDKLSNSFGKMLECVEKKKEWPETLTQAKKNVWNAMHSYTHGGLNQVSRRIKSSTIEPVVDEEEINELICFSELISFLSFTEIIEMSKVSNSKNEVLERMMESVVEGCFKKPLEAT
jgi:hypothetical protein